ncbi:MAG: HAMP domain-containing sensor histidine kinase [Legionella sp.]|uniref:sensor histidine kinase n=1 Tax=Legionella sp. TaxID=459 RepID=UPI002840B1B1|nr:HAMP domain-containing sensor histidine kinase [Legionella sp.]
MILYFLKKGMFTVYNYLMEKTIEASHQITLFGIVMMINFPLFGILWKLQNFQVNKEFFLRVIATTLCALLALHRFWSPKFLRILPFLWYLSLLFCLPFFFTYLTLLNDGATLWLMNCMSATFFLFLVTSALDSLVLLTLGSSLAYFSYVYGADKIIKYVPGDVSIFGLGITFTAAIIIGALFARDRELIYSAKISGMRLLAGSLAHDLRTPLSSIYLQAKMQKSLVETLPNEQEVKQNLNESIAKIERGIDSVNQLISTQLNNIRHDRFDTCKFGFYSINELLKHALEDFPFKNNQHELIDLLIECDFVIWIEKIAFRNLIWNLLNNSFDFIEKEGKGEVLISMAEGQEKDNFNYLHIKDTAQGISTEKAKLIFEPFYSERQGGTGIGLAYCKLLMKAAGGSIACQGKLGEYTHFTIKFPKID